MQHRRSIDPDSQTGAFEFQSLVPRSGVAGDALPRPGLGRSERQISDRNLLTGVDHDFARETFAALGETSEGSTVLPGDQFPVTHAQVCEFAGILLRLGRSQSPSLADRHDLDLVDEDEQGPRSRVLHHQFADFDATAVDDLSADFSTVRLERNAFDKFHTSILEDETAFTSAVSGHPMADHGVRCAVSPIQESLYLAAANGSLGEWVRRSGFWEFGAQGAAGRATGDQQAQSQEQNVSHDVKEV